MNICVSTNIKYYRYLYVMLQSLLENNREEDLDVYILNSELGAKEFDDLNRLTSFDNLKIHDIKVSSTDFKTFNSTLTRRYSIETFFRLKIPELLPKELDRVLYLDVDIIIKGRIEKLYNVDFDNNLFVVCQDMLTGIDDKRKQLFGRDDPRYFNSGVTLLNLSLLRKMDFERECFEGAKSLNYDIPCLDQDILNYLYYDKAKYLEAEKYNYLVSSDVQIGTDYKKVSPVILHYAGYNPWEAGLKTDAYMEWWKIAKKTPFYIELLEEQLLRNQRHLTDNAAITKDHLNEIQLLREENGLIREEKRHILEKMYKTYRDLWEEEQRHEYIDIKSIHGLKKRLVKRIVGEPDREDNNKLFTLSFTGAHYNIIPYVTGVSKPEDGFSWTDGDVMEVCVPVYDTECNTKYRVDIHFVGTFNGQKQMIIKDVDETKVADGRFEGEGKISFVLNSIQGWLRFVVYFTDAQYVDEVIESLDHRKVAFQMESISIYPE